MNDAIKWLYEQHVGSIPTGSSSCYLCGVPCPGQHTVAKGIADTFNSHYLATSPSSPWLCAACQWYFDSKAGHPDFRKMSLYVGKDGWEDWQRPLMKPLIEHWLRHGIPFDVYLIVSLSKKKHILLQSPLNVQDTKLLAIQVEEQVAYVDQTTWQIINRSFMHLLDLGHNKGEILSGQLYGNTLRKHGQIKDAMNHSQMLDPYRQSPQIELLSYVTIIEKGENDGADNTGEGVGRHSGSSIALESSVVTDRPRIQEQVSDGHLDTGGNERSGVRKDDKQSDAVSQQSLW